MEITLIDRRVEELVNILVDGGRCDTQSIDRARLASVDPDERVDIVLLRLGLVAERDLAAAYATLLNVPVADPAHFPVEPLLPERLKSVFLRASRALPVALVDNELTLAIVDGLDDYTPRAIGIATGFSINREIGVPIDLEAAFDRLYPERITVEIGRAFGEEVLEEDAERLKDLASEMPVISLVNRFLSRAVETHASDIHIEPFEDRVRVRYRYDGVLHEIESLHASQAPAIVSRIKIMAKLDIAERRRPQDGRIKHPVRGTDIDFRVSSAPTLYGEKVVLRVLDRNTVLLDYAKLGLPDVLVRNWSRALQLPNGILLVTGPTGSGKTTTLYTGLASLNAVTRNVVTVEDPIEYQLSGINQSQIRPQIDLDFAAMLRSILRQDPDVIMVGEIRDLETAQIAVQAALTGHLVLSTLHTNSAAAAITRLRDLGIEEYLMTAVIRGVLAQRLVRRLCDMCKHEAVAHPDIVSKFALQNNAGGKPVLLWEARGCPHCRGTGYRGRQAIAEFLEPNAAIRHLIFSKADQTEIERAAVSNGMTTMFHAGVAAALAGITTLDEVVRSVQAEV